MPAVIGVEQKGKGNVEYIDNSYGQIGTAICYDMVFPKSSTQEGIKDIDIILVPSADWKEIDPLHTRMAIFRAVKNGLNMVRQVKRAYFYSCRLS